MKAARNIQHLVVIRISDSSAFKELDKKARETATMYRDLPGAAELKKLGASPLNDPDKVQGRVVSSPGFRAVVFRIPGTQTWVLLALGSATKANLGEDDNAFVTLLQGTLSELQVDTLWVADFARLLRSIDYLSHTWKAVRTRCRRVRHAGAMIDTDGPTAEIQFLFEALSAAAEARWTVTKTTRGKMRAYLDGKCPMRNESVPLGYRRTKKGRIVRREPNVQPVIQEIVRVLGDASLTNRERVERVANAGGDTDGIALLYAGSKTAKKVSNPAQVVARWYRFLDVWRHGTWVVNYDLPAILDTTRFDLPIKLEPLSSGGRRWRMEFTLPIPAGGWATEDEFEAAVKVRDHRATVARARAETTAVGRRKPFTGLPNWFDGGFQYALHTHRVGYYQLRRRPAEQAEEARLVQGEQRRVARGWGRSPNKEGEVVGLVRADLLHRTVAEGLVTAATDGLDLCQGGEFLAGDDDMVEQLRAELSKEHRIIRNATRNSSEAKTDDERRDHRQVAQEARERAARLEADLVHLAAAAGKVPVDADAVARVLAAISDEPDLVDDTVANALRAVLADFRLVPVPGTNKGRWQVNLVLPMGGGTLTVGPATGTIELGTSRKQARLRHETLAGRAAEATQLLMRDGYDIRAVAQQLEILTPRRVAQTVRDHLATLGLTRAAASELVAATPVPARQVLWERLHKRPYPRHVPLPFAKHVADSYLTGELTVHPNRDGQAQRLQGVVDHIREKGGWLGDDSLDELCAHAGISRTTLTDYTTGRRRDGRWNPPVLEDLDGGVAVVACPHRDCSGWSDTVVVLPEVPQRLLCGQCRRVPDKSRPRLVFPDEYLTVHSRSAA